VAMQCTFCAALHDKRTDDATASLRRTRRCSRTSLARCLGSRARVWCAFAVFDLSTAAQGAVSAGGFPPHESLRMA
jgi:hypothetical protein